MSQLTKPFYNATKPDNDEIVLVIFTKENFIEKVKTYLNDKNLDFSQKIDKLFFHSKKIIFSN